MDLTGAYEVRVDAQMRFRSSLFRSLGPCISFLCSWLRGRGSYLGLMVFMFMDESIGCVVGEASCLIMCEREGELVLSMDLLDCEGMEMDVTLVIQSSGGGKSNY